MDRQCPNGCRNETVIVDVLGNDAGIWWSAEYIAEAIASAGKATMEMCANCGEHAPVWC